MRIRRAGGYVSFDGVWRVNGILAMSRALGNFLLKEKDVIVATPDTTVFNLRILNAEFIILATDGLWDVFTNEEAVDFIRTKLHEPYFGARSLVVEAFNRGSLDNITVLVVTFF